MVGSAFFGATVGGSIDLSNNNINRVEEAAFANAVILRTLNFRNNQIPDLVGLLFSFGSFGAIDLSNNKITHIVGGLFNKTTSNAGAFYNASTATLNLANNRLTALYADTFAGLRINDAANFYNNTILLLADGWYSAFPLQINLTMTGNPSVCRSGRLTNTLQTFVCTCAEDSRGDILGNGAFCSRANCPAPRNLTANGAVTDCSSSLFASGSDCFVTCDDGYELLDPSFSSITCLGGVWGRRPNLAATYPTCFPVKVQIVKTHGVETWKVALISVGSAVGGLLIAGIIYLLTSYRLRIRRVEYDLGLKEQLLNEQGEELDALRQVFTIPADEVRLETCIDSGAFGEVWRGRWNDMAVAVKRMRAVLLALDDSFAREFEAETTLMRRLRHANVVTFFGAGTDRDGMPFLVCELMANSLQKLVWVPSRLSEQRQVKWARDAAQGMAFLHTKGVIHRDLKSGNLLGGYRYPIFGGKRAGFRGGGGGGGGRVSLRKFFH